MSKKVTHIIHKLNLEIEVPDERLARKMYQQAGSLLQQYVLPQLEEILNRYDRDDLHIRLDTLNIDLNTSGNISLEEVIKEQLAQAIGRELDIVINKDSEDVPGSKTVRVKDADAVVDAFLWFLEHGSLPWWVEEKEIFSHSQYVIDAIALSEEKFVALFAEKVKNKSGMLKTLLTQYDAVLLTYLFSLMVSLELFSAAVEYEKLFIDSVKSKEDIQTLKLLYWKKVWTLYPVKNLPSVVNREFKSKVERFINEMKAPDIDIDIDTDHLELHNFEPSFFTPDHIIKEEKKDIVSDIDIEHPESDDFEHASFTPEDINKEQEKDIYRGRVKDVTEDTPYEEQALMGSNAGLILLHPFLQYFFKELGLLEEDAFKNERSCGIAVHLLHYLATGREQDPDFDLLFEKYLCGMNTSQITNRYIKLTSKMKTEADGLLQAVIRHWSVLKNTSAQGLQEGFLQRKGKLIVKEGNHKIIMEQSGLDILLQQVPWNISLVKFPWMKQLIHVEWDT